MRAFLLLVLLWLSTSCASAPMYRPVGPPMGGRGLEAGAALHGVVGGDVGGVGTAMWFDGRIATGTDVVARAHYTELVPYRGYAGAASDAQFGGSIGLRGSYETMRDLWLGGELLLDAQQINSTVTSTSQTFLSGILGFPVAEKAMDGVWVYVEPLLGAGYRFGDTPVPFGGFTEVPIGVAWQLNDGLLVVGEGGFAIPFSGGYGGVGVAMRW